MLLRPSERRLLREPWYHDFSPLGLATPQRDGIYPPNQESKQAPLFRLIREALALSPSPASVLELFCADGFYALYAAQRGARPVVGVDTDEAEIRKARLAARLLGLVARFEVTDVFAYDEPADVVICAGGLYHLADPEALLGKLRRQTGIALVVQTVFHLGRPEPDYFETPAPGWDWGCRFSFAYLRAMVSRTGWTILHEEVNELTGNERAEDRGSAYLLCIPAP